MSTKRRRLYAALALGGGWLVFFAQQLLDNGVPFERDILLTTLPARAFLQSQLRSGYLPQWYPYEMLGVPFIGQLVPATFHPQTLLLLLPFSVAQLTKLNILGAFLVALIGGYRAARALGTSRPAAVAGAYAFGFSGYLISMANNLPYLVPLATAPWVLWAALRTAARPTPRHIAVLGVLWALVFLGGDAQLFAECAVLVALAWGLQPSRRGAVSFAVAGVIASLLTCIELLPAMAIGAESARSRWSLDDTARQYWSMLPARLLNWTLPNFVPHADGPRLGYEMGVGPGGFWAATLFMGGLVILFAILACTRRSRAALLFGGLAVLGTWLALGPKAGLLKLVWRIAPVLGSMRYPEKYLTLTIVAVAMLAALGIDVARDRPRRAAALALAGCLIQGLLAALAARGALVEAVWKSLGRPLAPDSPLREELSPLWAQGLTTTAALLGAVAVVCWFIQSRSQARLLLPGLIFVELLAGNGGHLPLASPELVTAYGAFTDGIVASGHIGNEPLPRTEKLRSPSPVATPTSDALVEATHLWQLSDDPGRAGVGSLDQGLPGGPARAIMLFDRRVHPNAQAFEPLYNVCYRVTPLGEPPAPGERENVRSDDFQLHLLERPCVPRAFVAGALPVANEPESAMRIGTGLPAGTVVWEGGPQLEPARGDVKWLVNEPTRQRFSVRADKAAAFVVTDAFARGWSATIDGQPTPIYPTLAAARGIAVPAGEHLVEMRYRTPGFALGCVLTLVGLIIAGVMMSRRPAPLE